MGCQQLPVAIESDFADPGETGCNGAAMAASEAAQATIVESFEKLRFLRQFAELIG